MNRSKDQSVSLSADGVVGQSVSQSVSTGQSVSQPVGRSVGLSVSQSHVSEVLSTFTHPKAIQSRFSELDNQ